MDTPYAIQQYLLNYGPLVAALAAGNNGTAPYQGGVYLLELPPTIAETEATVPPFQCTVVRAGGGAAVHGQVLPLNDLDIIMQSYGQTPHLAYNIDSIVYQALKYLVSYKSVVAGTYLHWCKPKTRPIPLRDPDLQWPYVSSVWTTLASDVTITS